MPWRKRKLVDCFESWTNGHDTLMIKRKNNWRVLINGIYIASFEQILDAQKYIKNYMEKNK